MSEIQKHTETEMLLFFSESSISVSVLSMESKSFNLVGFCGEHNFQVLSKAAVPSGGSPESMQVMSSIVPGTQLGPHDDNKSFIVYNNFLHSMSFSN